MPSVPSLPTAFWGALGKPAAAYQSSPGALDIPFGILGLWGTVQPPPCLLFPPQRTKGEVCCAFRRKGQHPAGKCTRRKELAPAAGTRAAATLSVWNRGRGCVRILQNSKKDFRMATDKYIY
jgi:hypothetical protein